MLSSYGYMCVAKISKVVKW